MGVFFENAGFVFMKMGVFSKNRVCFLKIRVFLENWFVFRKCGVFFFFENGSFWKKIEFVS